MPKSQQLVCVLQVKLEALKREDLISSMSDNQYHISGRYATRQRRIREIRAQLKKLEAHVPSN